MSMDRNFTESMFKACPNVLNGCSKKIDEKLDEIVWNAWPKNILGMRDLNVDARKAMRDRLVKLFCKEYPRHGWCSSFFLMLDPKLLNMTNIFNTTTNSTTLAPPAPTVAPAPPPMAPQMPQQPMIQMQPPTFAPPTTEGFLAANVSRIIGSFIGLSILGFIAFSVIMYFVQQKSSEKKPGSKNRSQKKHQKAPKKEKEQDSDESSRKGAKSKSLSNV